MKERDEGGKDRNACCSSQPTSLAVKESEERGKEGNACCSSQPTSVAMKEREEGGKDTLIKDRKLGTANFTSNTKSLHCHHQNDSALRWAAV